VTSRATAVAAAVLRAPVAAYTWRATGYTLLGVILAGPAFVLALLGLVSSVVCLVLVGLPVLVVVLLAARGMIGYFRWPARVLLGWDWPPPPRIRGRGLLRRARAVLGDGPAWQALVYCLVKLPLVASASYLTALALIGGLYCLTCPVWAAIAPTGFGPIAVGSWGASWNVAVAGAVFLLLFPWLPRGFVALDRVLSTALLAPSPARQRVATLESQRAALTADAASTLRRVERDLHDGTQARLVSLGMTLSRIEQRLARLSEGAVNLPAVTAELNTLIGSARGNVTDALTELRDIVRRVHPPALDDGLAVALSTLVTQSGMLVDVSIQLRTRPDDVVATTLYFTAAELLTNAARHAGTARVRLQLTEDDEWIRLVVTDDGRGGAAPGHTGSGLAGLSRRARALDGRLDIVSPTGGPTTITMILPKAG
jgi:signal transduction histidine kinase